MSRRDDARIGVFLLCAALASAGCSSETAAEAKDPVTSTGGAASTTADAGDAAAATPEAGAPRASWSAFGRDLAQSRAVLDDPYLTPEAIPSLAEAYRIPAAGVTATPAVADGIVYFADWEGNVYARALDGTEVWTKKYDHGFSSSPAVSGDLLYLSDRTNVVLALKLSDGSLAWSTPIPASGHAYLWSSPAIASGMLVIGLAGYATQDGGKQIPDEVLGEFRGAILGLDATTGGIKWRFETTVGPDGTQYGAGVSSWSSAAIDEERGLAFIGTSNSYFVPASPYSDSLLALNYRTGALVWHRQFTADDAFRAGRANGPDFDVGAAPNLFQAKGQDVVGVGDKGGSYRVLSRDDGSPVWEQKLTGGSGSGGVMAPAAVAEGVIYVTSNDAGTQTQVFALGADAGDILWQQSQEGISFGAPTYVDGVLFTAPASGTAYALDAKHGGATLWTASLMLNHGGGFSVAEGFVFTGVGFDYFNKGMEPLEGALVALRVPR